MRTSCSLRAGPGGTRSVCPHRLTDADSLGSVLGRGADRAGEGPDFQSPQTTPRDPRPGLSSAPEGDLGWRSKCGRPRPLSSSSCVRALEPRDGAPGPPHSGGLVLSPCPRSACPPLPLPRASQTLGEPTGGGGNQPRPGANFPGMLSTFCGFTVSPKAVSRRSTGSSHDLRRRSRQSSLLFSSQPFSLSTARVGLCDVCPCTHTRTRTGIRVCACAHKKTAHNIHPRTHVYTRVLRVGVSGRKASGVGCVGAGRCSAENTTQEAHTCCDRGAVRLGSCSARGTCSRGQGAEDGVWGQEEGGQG